MLIREAHDEDLTGILEIYNQSDMDNGKTLSKVQAAVIYNKDCNYTDEFFDTLIKSIEQLRAEGFFKSVYQEHILINFEVREYYQEDEMLEIFKRLNTKEELSIYAKWL